MLFEKTKPDTVSYRINQQREDQKNGGQYEQITGFVFAEFQLFRFPDEVSNMPGAGI